MVSSFFLAFRTFGEMLLPELDRLKKDIQSVERGLAPDEFRQLLDRGKALVVDVRPNEEYHHAHFDDAVSIPLTELPSRLHELPRSKVVVPTCRGPYCPLAIQAVTLLREAGFEAAHFDLDEFGEREGPEQSAPVAARTKGADGAADEFSEAQGVEVPEATRSSSPKKTAARKKRSS